MSWVCTSSDDSSDESANLPAVNVKPEPSSESDSSSDSDSSRDGYPFTRSRFGGRSRTLFSRERSAIRTDRRPTLPRRGRRPIKVERNGSLPRAGPHNMPSTSSHTATGRESPYRDIDYQDLSSFVPEAMLTADGLTVSYALGYAVIPPQDVHRRVIFTGPNSLAAQLPGTEEWINVPNGVTLDPHRRGPKLTIIPYHYLRNNLLPPLPITPTPPGTVVDGVPHSLRTDNCPPAVPTVPPAIPIVPTVPPAIPIVPTVPPAVPIKIIKSEIISDDEDVADTDVFYEVHNDDNVYHDSYENIDTELHNDDNVYHDAYENIDTELHNDASNDADENIDTELHNDASNDANKDIDVELHNDASKVAVEDIDTELHNDASNDWELDTDEDIDAFKDIDTDILEAQVNLVLQNMESKKQPVVERSESNEEPLEEKNIPQVMSSSEHFYKELRQKDSCDPTFGDGFEIDKIMNPKLRDDGVFLFEVQWRHENFAGTDILEAPIIYDHWPDVALEFYHNRYGHDKEILKEITDC